MKNKLDDYYSTYDLSLASTLLAMEFRLENVDRANGYKSLFIFKQTPELKKSIQLYWGDLLKVSPIKLFNAQKLLKNRIYSEGSHAVE